MYSRSLTTLLLLAAFGLAAPPPLSPELGRVARQKIERIEQRHTEPGETIVFTEDELNSLLKYEYAPEMPEGVRDVTVRLMAERATIRAYLDIGKLQEASGGSFGGLWAMLFRGEKELLAQCRAVSEIGRAHVEVESVQFDGTTLPAPLLKWLISATVTDEDPGERNRVTLPDSLRELRIAPDGAVVVAN
ncbi:MAG: hypothetical protein O2968_15815 [Acidobacteria bacterium]|nr:hypothetical protein [Acidobacteriota bacterium]